MPPRLDPRHRSPSEVAADGCESVTDELAGPEVEVLLACKYVPVDEMGALAEAGRHAGRREPPAGPRRQARRAMGEAFTWDFIGNLQSRKVKQILPLVRLIHSVGTDSVLTQLGSHGTAG